MSRCSRWPRYRLAGVATLTGSGLLAAIFLLLTPASPVARAQAAAPLDCEMVTQNHTRTVQIWYGSLLQDSTVLTDAVELTDHVSGVLAQSITDTPQIDDRVKMVILSWVSGVFEMEWVLGAPENLPAEQQLRERLSGAAPNVTFEPVVRHADQAYILAAWTTNENAPECPGGTRQVFNQGIGQAELHELNARVEPTATATPTETPTATPTPTTPFRAYLPLLVR